MTTRRQAGSAAAWLVALAAATGLWELAYRLKLVDPLIIGSPSLIVRAAAGHGLEFVHACGVTVSEIAAAIAIS